MDRYLQRLKRAATYNPEAKEAYITALERAVSGAREEEHPHFEDARIASVWIKDNPDLEEEIFNNFEILNGYYIRDESGNRTGFLFDVYWDQNYDEQDFEELEINLSEDLEQLFADAANRGYTMLVFWR